jgi:hypothetical protein
MQNTWLALGFVAYVIANGILFLLLPRLLATPDMKPWDYWWLFLIGSPTFVVGILFQIEGLSKRAIGLFYLGAVAFGLFLGWFSYALLAAI